jgi:ribose transport system substrate-binding protein
MRTIRVSGNSRPRAVTGVILALTMGLAACGGAGSSAPAGTANVPGSSVSSSPATGDGDYTIALVSALASISYYTTMNCGAQAAAAEQGVEVIYEAPNNFDAAEQQQILNSLFVRDLDGLIIVPADTVALNNTLTEASKDMPVMTTDLNPSEQIGLAAIASDGKEGGALAAEHMAKQLAGKTGSVLVLANNPNIIPVVQRAEGFIEKMAELVPDVEVLPIEYSGGEPSDAATIVSNTLRGHPDLVGVFATFEPSVFGTMSAVAGTDREDDLVIVGYDANPAEVDALREGKLAALVIQTPYEMGYQSVTQMSKLLKGEITAESIQYDQKTPLVLATADNLTNPDVEKYLYTDEC